eukprot:CAMPEP_0168591210 /NCGR_PEP_ID=MMETSP0420-20121227/7004_1 /TAXON_ID=498008 /ORGANISM="Pessonella sp." /LENGTH=159 /DNA_ID=CAMNT_0008626969 /DNA_START=60 /DNA_END=539 /DNA_ORIENTATION=+
MAARQRRRLRREESALQLTDEQVNELKEAFEFFDKSGTGSIDKKTLKASVNELGVDADVDEMFKEADSGKTGAITFPMFLSMMSSRMMQVDSEDNLKGAFKVFDPELAGFIDAGLLKKQLTTLGEPLNGNEWEEFAAACVNGGQVDYQLFVNTVYSSKV